MARFDAQLHWIEGQIPRMEASIEHWCGVNSGSHNRAGIERVGDEVLKAFAPLEARVRPPVGLG